MNEQTKAQRLAEWFEKGHGGCELEAAAELRRLDALNAELVAAFEKLMLDMDEGVIEVTTMRNANAALAKAKEQT